MLHVRMERYLVKLSSLLIPTNMIHLSCDCDEGWDSANGSTSLASTRPGITSAILKQHQQPLQVMTTWAECGALNRHTIRHGDDEQSISLAL